MKDEQERVLMKKETVEKTSSHVNAIATKRVTIENLTQNEKIVKAISSCQIYLEKSTAASKSTSEESDNWLWHAGAELEYALFLFSLRSSDENVALAWKTEPYHRGNSAAKLLKRAQDLLTQSRKSLAAGNWLQAHENVYAAGNVLLSIQRDRAKKKKQTFRKRAR